MIPEVGMHVKCLLKNNAIAEGIVEEWFNYVKLKSLDGKSILIIHHPDQDIMLTKIVLDDDEEDVKKPVMGSAIPMPPIEEAESGDVLFYKNGEMIWADPNKDLESETLEEQFEQVYEQPSDNPNRIKKLAELRIEMGKAERDIIVKKLKDHNIVETKKVEYGYPGFFEKPRT